jgi:hypothetical protein
MVFFMKKIVIFYVSIQNQKFRFFRPEFRENRKSCICIVENCLTHLLVHKFNPKRKNKPGIQVLMAPFRLHKQAEVPRKVT